VRDVLLLDAAEGKSQAYREAVTDFAMRFQQYTAPLMAKGLEDTAFYVYFPLVSLNEVGGDPARFGFSVEAFHHFNEERSNRWPHDLIATSTHDSKRSEDVRARINVLSEIPDQSQNRLMCWSRLNKEKKQDLEGLWAPDRNDEYLLYQTLLGFWPSEDLDVQGLDELRGRLQDYMRKAAREAKVHTSWVNINTKYEEALEVFIDALLDARHERNRFLDDFLPFQRSIAPLGTLNSLSQVLLKLTSPGIPDIYQGTELWCFTLVDPDNRRPVDYAHRRRLLQELETRFGGPQEKLAQRARDLLATLEDGRTKLYVLWRALHTRREFPSVFSQGDYRALSVHGRWAEHVCAFARSDGVRHAITVAHCACGKFSRSKNKHCP
jgi:(1->4)-alpha-D-glucan 1-alpha-D-glucosylmutase